MTASPYAPAPCVHGFAHAGAAKRPKAGSACERPQMLACSRCGLVVTVDCHSTRTITCQPCGLRYRERVRRVARVHRGGLLLVTLTAPGSPGHMRQTADGDWTRCSCAPVDFDETALAAWNASLGERWNRFLNNGVLRDSALSWLWTWDAEAGKDRVVYFKASEAQRRGALHLHVLVRVPDGLVVTPRMVEDLGRMAEGYDFGHVLDVQYVEGHRAAGYVAKYVSKGSNDRPDVPWLREHATFGPIRGRATFRAWTASRSWPMTMRWLRGAQWHHANVLAVLGSWEGTTVPEEWAALVPARPLFPEDRLPCPDGARLPF